jgi:hypothetical protein
MIGTGKCLVKYGALYGAHTNGSCRCFSMHASGPKATSPVISVGNHVAEEYRHG